MITNVVRCLPPQNKPNSAEVSNCQPYLAARLAHLPQLHSIMTLGKIAHDALIRMLGLRLADYPFAHGAEYAVSGLDGRALKLHACYHCSRYNMNTRRLTEAMFDDILTRAKDSAGL
jgi:uracil-DNA glycosylase family 4